MEEGNICGLCMEQGEMLSVDLYVDCLGFVGLLMKKVLNVLFRSYCEILFNDVVVVLLI